MWWLPLHPANQPTGWRAYAEQVPAFTTLRVVRVTSLVAFLGILLAVAGLVLAAQPLHTETQNCGTAGSFLLDGRVNEFVDPTQPPAGITSAEAKANNAEPCQERAANRAWPAGILVVAGTLVALLSLTGEFMVRAVAGRRRLSQLNP